MTQTNDRLLIILPTMGAPELVVSCVERLLMHRGATHLQLVVVANSNTPQFVAMSHFQVEAMVQAHNDVEGAPTVDLEWLDLGAPAGWPGAVNAGLNHVLDDLAPYVVIMNDDVLVTPGWADRLRDGMEADRIHLHGELATYGQEYVKGPGKDRADYGRIGMVGPTTNNAAGAQGIQAPALQLAPGEGFTLNSGDLLDQFAAKYAIDNGGTVLATDFLSGFLIMYDRECLMDLLETGSDGRKWLLDPAYNVGGYDDNDVAVRAELAGWRRGIVLECYVHHLGSQTLDRHYPEALRGCANIGVFLDKWQEYTQRDQTLGAVYRVRLQTMNDLLMLRASLDRVGQLCDAVGVLLTDNPAKITQSPDWQLGGLQAAEALLVTACSEAEGPDGVRKAMGEYLDAVAAKAPRDLATVCDVWTGTWNERDERNRSVELADELAVDWVLSVDHDELVEDRITRSHMERFMHHPNPGVMVYDLGWLNHWDSPRLCRVDPPWAAPEYRSSMRGFRLWRRTAAAPRRIQGGTEIGLHCGNCPDFEISAKRVAALRMRHFGYMRHADRVRKWQWYNQIDPSPSPELTQARREGGGYEHLVNEEGMALSPYVARDGIAFSMLVYKDEQALGLERQLSHVYGMADRIVLVWTGEDSEPTKLIKTIGDAYGAEWVHHRLDHDLAAARNAGIQAVRDADDPGISWFFTMDDDEAYESDFQAMVALRRMAEVSDSYGWMFRFRNYREDGTWNWSETTRMMRLDPQGIVRYSGRVHETVELAFRDLQHVHGIHPQVRYAPFSVNHFGLTGSPEELQPKLEKYTELLIREIKDRPKEASPWVSLALQYGNDGRDEERDRCLAQAVRYSGRGYLPFKIVADVHLRQAKQAMRQALERLAPAHPYHKMGMEVLQWLDANAADQPVGGSGANGGTAIPAGFDLAELEALVAPTNGSTTNGGGARLEDLRARSGGVVGTADSQPPPPGV